MLTVKPSQLKQLQLGVSLVESMIALLIISIGLLGIAALQVTSISQNSSALHHSQAVLMAYNMADRIRANNAQFALYANINTDNGYVDPDCITKSCLDTEIVTADAAHWEIMVSNLPAGRGTISNNANASDGLLIAVMWDDGSSSAAGGGAGSTPCPDATLSCYLVVIKQ
ncbi:MAG: type IV pilus assembly protein PilV [Gammaproteobacteria bacterium]|jgi:type IV pilus assembly protein PilV